MPDNSLQCDITGTWLVHCMVWLLTLQSLGQYQIILLGNTAI